MSAITTKGHVEQEQTTRTRPCATFGLACRAPAEAVYDLLADPATHLEWGGRRQNRMFRLVSLQGPKAPATVGTVFTSAGRIPGSRRHFEDRSTVTVANRPSTFELATASTAGRGSAVMEATFRHRYELHPDGEGCRLVYTLSQEQIERPILRFRLVPMRAMMWKVGIPSMMRRGCANLVRMAEWGSRLPPQ